ncbi:glycosyltransferase [Novosphingobium sp. ST904]|uniref:glycosyltransferase n=1 Tax=Novosphingobium sp. ST904 TaxID=1684385 RepID=UPI0006C8CBFF|nr:glycosyltransferase [Novosphingobium sp. ST904]KPH65756.1 hypothetical protein ADT71_10305 [Novosphingobium sp. ST904]TCM37332.1 glycosyltransferase involved in cell wall biosynthesis [Novosphingobium sp. ST904]
MARVWCFPGEENRHSNPYTAILIGQLRRLGHSPSSPGWKERFTGTCDILHLHWPQKVIQPGLLRSLRTIAAWAVFLALQKARGAKIVWTMHNAVSHEQLRPRLERFWMARFMALLDGIHAMSESSLAQARLRHPVLTRIPALVAPHWTYSGAYPPPAATIGLRRDTVSFLGDIKGYKGLDDMLAALENAEPDSRRYLVHGLPESPAEAAALEARLAALSGRGWRMEWVLTRLSDQEMADRLNETLILLLPYRRGENSGLAILAAERGTPVMVSGISAFSNLLDELGPPRVTAITAPLSHRQIAEAAQAAAAVAGAVPLHFVARRSPERVVAEISNYYLFLMDSGGRKLPR